MVREVRFTKVRDRQVSKFNRLLHKNNLEGNRDDRQVANNNNTSGNNSQTQTQMQSHTCINKNQPQGSSSREGNNVWTVRQGNKWLVNLSKSSLTQAQESLLSRGPNFPLAPTNPPNAEFILAVESACQKLLEQDAHELRAEINY